LNFLYASRIQLYAYGIQISSPTYHGTPFGPIYSHYCLIFEFARNRGTGYHVPRFPVYPKGPTAFPLFESSSQFQMGRTRMVFPATFSCPSSSSVRIVKASHRSSEPAFTRASNSRRPAPSRPGRPSSAQTWMSSRTCVWSLRQKSTSSPADPFQIKAFGPPK